MTRGRLIFPMIVRVARLDTQGTKDYDPSGPETSGYDPIFEETTLGETASGIGAESRQELASIDLLGQIEDDVFELLRMGFSGNMPDFRIGTLHHFKELEKKNLVDPTTKEPLLVVGDRLVGIYTRRGVLSQSPPEGGLFAVMVNPISHGFGGSRNLLLILWNDRKKGTERAA